MSAVTRVGVVGPGQMGCGFAEVCARAGADVVVVARGEASAERGRQRLEKSLDRLVAKGKMGVDERAETLARVAFSWDVGALADREFVLEATPEDLDRKLAVFAELDEVVSEADAVLASTTSALSIMKLGRATRDPGRVLGVHLFNPVQVMPLVELISSLATDPAIAERARAFLEDVLGKQVVWAKDRAGFVVNSLLVPYLLAAVRLVESGVASAEDVDRGMTAGCGHPMGPLRLIDLIGLDTIAAVGEAMYAETKEALHAPPALLLRMVEGGYLGRKTGEGFFSYR
ncbi:MULTISPECIES: 3-hydroxybutyryl-CoA dehydrogenase [unclassified Saccharothrix]|uniref:3-hydroxybutyryl-CoA dehydrogenase n=1 Tax=unclassified Saccharothrix TaxID=2593673 RepID=UPI00307FB681